MLTRIKMTGLLLGWVLAKTLLIVIFIFLLLPVLFLGAIFWSEENFLRVSNHIYELIKD